MIIVLLLMVFGWSMTGYSQENKIANWQLSFPRTDFTNKSIDFNEIIDGGPGRGGIPSIDRPIFESASVVRLIGAKEPMITVEINGDARAYPIHILMYHEVVNDVVGGVPILITYCPLCNASLTFKRTVDGRVLKFEATGKLRKSDLVMYDRQTESWWQQFTGEGIVGDYTGRTLRMLPSRIESFTLFKERHPDGKVQVPNDRKLRNYGINPYYRYDSMIWPAMFDGEFDEDIRPLSRVVAVGNDAWPLKLLKDKKTITYGDLQLSWIKGQNSALNRERIRRGRDIGNVIVTRNNELTVYQVPFAFAFRAFNPTGIIHSDE